MSLLSRGTEAAKTKPVEDRIYNAGWIGSITSEEMEDAKQGDVDRETGLPRCAFCRQPKPLKTGNGTTCDAYCEKQQHGWVPWGRKHPFDKQDRGREWLTLG